MNIDGPNVNIASSNVNIASSNVKIKSSNVKIKSSNVKVKSSNVTNANFDVYEGYGKVRLSYVVTALIHSNQLFPLSALSASSYDLESLEI